jgi:hypothetical protein
LIFLPRRYHLLSYVYLIDLFRCRCLWQNAWVLAHHFYAVEYLPTISMPLSTCRHRNISIKYDIVHRVRRSKKRALKSRVSIQIPRFGKVLKQVVKKTEWSCHTLTEISIYFLLFPQYPLFVLFLPFSEIVFLYHLMIGTCRDHLNIYSRCL